MQNSTKDLDSERWELLEHIDEVFKKPMIVLSFIWLVLIILELTKGIDSTLLSLSYFIWIIFIIDFFIEFLIAPQKKKYLKNNWLTTLSLLVPAFRILRVFRGLRVLKAVSATRSVILAKLLTSLNRSMRATRAAFGQRNLGFVIILTFILTIAGAAGIYHFENTQILKQAGINNVQGIDTYTEALWWTSMIMTTMGSDYWPYTAEGRILTVLLSIYTFAVFGYITAAIASILVGKDIKRNAI